MLLMGMFTALRGMVKIACVRDEFAPQEFKIRAGPVNNLTLMHQTLLPIKHISLLLQYLLVSGSKNTNHPLGQRVNPLGSGGDPHSTDATS